MLVLLFSLIVQLFNLLTHHFAVIVYIFGPDCTCWYFPVPCSYISSGWWYICPDGTCLSRTVYLCTPIVHLVTRLEILSIILVYLFTQMIRLILYLLVHLFFSESRYFYPDDGNLYPIDTSLYLVGTS